MIQFTALTFVVVVILLLVGFMEKQPRRKARREAACEYEDIMRSIQFCSHISYIEDLQDEVLDYSNTWKSLIDIETLNYFTGSMYKALAERQTLLQAERIRRYNKHQLN